jgi:hypothetical protein
MKLFVAVVGSVIIFIGAGLLSLLILTMVCPKPILGIEVDLGFINGSISTLAAVVIATLAAVGSFKASLRHKYKK